MKNNFWKVLGIVLFSISFIFVCIGFDKLQNVNSIRNMYFNGDVYNYIINASRATAYFAIAIFLSILSIGCGVFYYFSNLTTTLDLINTSSDSIDYMLREATFDKDISEIKNILSNKTSN